MEKTQNILKIKQPKTQGYYFYTHSYLNYANLAWVSAYETNLKKLRSQQKRDF